MKAARYPNELPDWLDRRLNERGWSVTDLATRAGLSASMIFRWRQGYIPHVGNARAAADALDVPVLDLLVASGLISSEEAHTPVTSLRQTPTAEIIDELHRRTKQPDPLPAGPELLNFIRNISRASTAGQMSETDLAELSEVFKRHLQKQAQREQPALQLTTQPDAADDVDDPVADDPDLVLHSNSGERYHAYRIHRSPPTPSAERNTPQ